VPAATPVIIPVDPAVAVPVAVLLHIPPVVASLNEVVLPTHTLSVPVIDDGVVGTGLTVTIEVVVPHPVV
jgi:hypothetical protein